MKSAIELFEDALRPFLQSEDDTQVPQVVVGHVNDIYRALTASGHLREPEGYDKRPFAERHAEAKAHLARIESEMLGDPRTAVSLPAQPGSGWELSEEAKRDIKAIEAAAYRPYPLSKP